MALPVNIVPRGFPRSQDFSGYIGSNVITKDNRNNVSFQVNLPRSIEQGSSEYVFKIYSSNFASLVEAIEALIQDPNGCFEQTSATTYPMVMGLNFLKALPEQTPKVKSLIVDTEARLKKGY